MKKLILTMIVFVACLNTMICSMDANDKPNFVVAQPGEDLAAYKKILLLSYLKHTNAGEEDYTTEAVEKNFPILVQWVGQPGKRFVKVLDGETPVGFMTFEALNDEQTHIAIHASPILPEYAKWYAFWQSCLKQEFPKANTVSTACSSGLGKMQELIKKLGFQQDDSYECNKEFFLKNLVGYTRKLD